MSEVFTKIRNIHQLVPNLAKKDGVGNEVICMQESLQNMGFASKIFHVTKGEEGISQNIYEASKEIDPKQDVLIYHVAVGSEAKEYLLSRNQRYWLRHHNITPSCFFEKIQDIASTKATQYGLEQLPFLAMSAEAVLSVSQYNLLSIQPYMSESTRVDVLPILRKYDALKNLEAPFEISFAEIVRKKKTILFVGRICPNKAQQDLIEFLYLYRKVYGEVNLRLVLLGSFYSPGFAKVIQDFASNLGLKYSQDVRDFGTVDILFREKTSDAELAFWYEHSNLFVSTSEHEGFCIPIVEALSFSLPILAHPAAAIPETLGNAGILVDKRDSRNFLEAMRSFLKDESTMDNRRSYLQNAMDSRYRELGYDSVNKGFLEVIKKYF